MVSSDGAAGTGAEDVLVDLDARSLSALSALGRAMHVKEAELDATLDAVLTHAVEIVGGAEFAGVNLLVRGKFKAQAVLGAPPHELDREQQRTNVGPCIDASREQTIIEVADMRTESRWPEYAALAVRVGVLSMLCAPLWVDDMRVGSLSLYATKPAAFDGQAINIAGLLATHAALALSDAQRTAYLRQAIANRDVIGAAKGILMERHKITSQQAFDVLSRASQVANRKVVSIAETLTTTGALPGE